MRLLIIDTETGGLSPQTHSIMSLGAVVWEDGKILDEGYWWIAEPTIYFEKQALDANKIDVNWLAENGLSPADAVAQLHAFLEKWLDTSQFRGILLCGHNVGFDYDFLKRLYGLAGFVTIFEKLFDYHKLDTAGIAKYLQLKGKIPPMRLNLRVLAEHFQLGTQDHNALHDARLTGLLLNKLLEL